MALQNLSAPSRASSRVHAGTAQSGVVHVKVRHAAHYTVIGNHLVQHRSLSLVAIGLAAYIQSLPTGARIGIKRLTERFREGETRISGALRELEAHGYLERSRVRLPDGRVITRTVSFNRPSARGGPPLEPVAEPEPVAPAQLEPGPGAEPERVAAPEPPPVPDPGAMPEPAPPWGPDPEPEPEPEPDPESGPDPEPAAAPPPPPPQDPGPGAEVAAESGSEPAAAPGPVQPPEASLRQAEELLARLRGDDPRLLLAERDVRQLAPGVAEWLERGAEPEAVRLVLSSELPSDLRHPAGLIAYRLKAWAPPELPAPPPVRAVRPPDPLQNCDGCDRAFRAPAPGRCRDCPSAP
ncbi:helix-turn-helix domain-containing protein [Streptomyces sp. NBC_00096]|uniref:helix-turn-helix domain-containing protein n=1 Tax=Streptomyces sp. NBC_00096 TaxID=2975650 RepID=UPI003248F9BE